MTSRATRRALMTERDRALVAKDYATYQRLTREIAALPLDGVRPLTTRDIARYVGNTDAAPCCLFADCKAPVKYAVHQLWNGKVTHSCEVHKPGVKARAGIDTPSRFYRVELWEKR